VTIPTDLDRWDPRDVTAWLAALEEDQTVTDAEVTEARRAVSAALIDPERTGQ
jgi:hypothetical protein